jgi:maleate isomerase
MRSGKSSDPVRVGYISASDPDELAYDFGGVLPDGLEMLGVAPRAPIRVLSPEALVRAEAGLEEAADELVRQDVSAIILSIAPLVYVKGLGYDGTLARRLEKRTSLPVTTNQTAAVEALRAVGVDNIVLLSPNTRELLGKQVAFFEASGIRVVRADCLDIRDNLEINRLDEQQSYEFIRVSLENSSDAAGLYLSGPCWRTLNLIGPLEAETGRPVITSLQSTVWAAKGLVGDGRKVSGYGRLLSSETFPGMDL